MSTPQLAIDRPIPLRLAVLPRTSILTDAALVAAGVLFVGLLAQISIPLGFTPVPITAQTFAVALIGTAYGANLGALTLFAYYIVGMIGAPLYSDGGSGWDHATGPTAGYLIGFIVAAWIMGKLAEQRWDRRLSSSIALMLTGQVAIYAFGLTWLGLDLNLSFDTTLEQGLYPFVPGMIVKLYLAAALCPAAWKLVERVRRGKG
jgi:biotin transport system substrate-specific component